jgi:hypothetical protein
MNPSILRDVAYAVLGFVPYHVMRRQLQMAPFPEGATGGSLPGSCPVLVSIIGASRRSRRT